MLGITFPASLREFYSLKGAPSILEEYGYSDVAVPIEELGDPEELEHGVIRFLDDGQGMGGGTSASTDLTTRRWSLDFEAPGTHRRKVSRTGRSARCEFPPRGRALLRVRRPACLHLWLSWRPQGRRKLKPYHGSLTFDDEGRATDVHFSGPPSVNGVPLFQRPVDASVMSLLHGSFTCGASPSFTRSKSSRLAGSDCVATPGSNALSTRAPSTITRWKA